MENGFYLTISIVNHFCLSGLWTQVDIPKKGNQFTVLFQFYSSYRGHRKESSISVILFIYVLIDFQNCCHHIFHLEVICCTKRQLFFCVCVFITSCKATKPEYFEVCDSFLYPL